jgi:hypothetical protein
MRSGGRVDGRDLIRPTPDLAVFRELRDLHYFRRVGILAGAVTWPHEQDLAPESLLAGLKPVEGWTLE